MSQEKILLEVQDLVVQYQTNIGIVEAVNEVSFSINEGETLGLVGETGAGKTTIALSVIGLLPQPPAKIRKGSIKLAGKELTGLTGKQMAGHRGKDISMIFQDPMTALNPSMMVGDQIAEVIKIHDKCSSADSQKKAVDMLKLVGIRPERYRDFPHQFSGGMKQRVVIAIALACSPRLLIADEPTTALDVTIQAQVLDMMKRLKTQLGTAMLMITHDLGVVAEVCDKVAVIYAGEIVEYGTAEHIFESPEHPYTIGLFESLPSLDKKTERLHPISGLMPDPMSLNPWCNFSDRCPYCDKICKEGLPPYVETVKGHFVRCFHVRSNSSESGHGSGGENE